MWKNLKEIYNNEPIPNVITEMQRKYEDYNFEEIESLVSYENVLLRQKHKAWTKELIRKKGMNKELFYDLVLHPWSYPSLVILDHKIEMPLSFYWKTWILSVEHQALKWQRSVGRIFNTKSKTWQSCFIIDKNKVITTANNLSHDDCSYDIKDWLGVDFSTTPPHDYKDYFTVVKVDSYVNKNQLVILELSDKSIEGKESPAPLSLSFDKIDIGEKLATIGYPNQFSIKKDIKDRVTYTDGTKLDYKNISLGIFEGYRNLQLGKHSCSILSGCEGAPIINLSTGYVTGIIHSSSENNFLIPDITQKTISNI